MFLFEPFKDNRMWRRVLSVAFGAAFVVWGLVSIFRGSITAFDYSLTFHVARNPVGFCLVVALVLYLGVGCIYRGVSGKG